MRKIISFLAALLLLYTFMPCSLSANNLQADSLVQEAWNALGQNDLKKAELDFRSAVRENPRSARAFAGLSILYELQSKDEEA
jgi:Tfp pilus assembly protein PilF